MELTHVELRRSCSQKWWSCSFRAEREFFFDDSLVPVRLAPEVWSTPSGVGPRNTGTRLEAALMCAFFLAACARGFPNASLTVPAGATASAFELVGYLEGHATIGPLRPAEGVGGPPLAQPFEAYAARSINIFNEDGTTLVTYLKLKSDVNRTRFLGTRSWLRMTVTKEAGHGDEAEEAGEITGAVHSTERGRATRTMERPAEV